MPYNHPLLGETATIPEQLDILRKAGCGRAIIIGFAIFCVVACVIGLINSGQDLISEINTKKEINQKIRDSENEIESLNKLLQTNTMDKDLYFRRAMEHENIIYWSYRNGNTSNISIWQQAELSDLNKVLEIDPTFGKAYGFRGILYEALGMKIEALNSYKAFLNYVPPDIPAEGISSIKERISVLEDELNIIK